MGLNPFPKYSIDIMKYSHSRLLEFPRSNGTGGQMTYITCRMESSRCPMKHDAKSNRHLPIGIPHRKDYRISCDSHIPKISGLNGYHDRANPEILAQQLKLFRNPSASTALDPLK